VENNGEVEISDLQYKFKGVEVWGVDGFMNLSI
jgi:hypothetical protein